MGIHQHLLAGVTYQAGNTVYASAGSYTFTVPEGVYSINYEIISGGGAGGYSIQSGDIRAGSGGGSGGWVSGSVAVVPLSTVSIIVGGGGAASTSSGAAANGAASSINAGSLITATGGQGGYGPVGDNAAPYGGAGGTPNGVAGSNIYGGLRNTAVTELGGVNSKSIGNGGNGRRGDGGVASTSGGSGRVTISW